MKISEKFQCLKKWGTMTTFKLGAIIKCKNNKCYKTNEWVKWITYFYYYGMSQLLGFGLLFLVLAFSLKYLLWFCLTLATLYIFEYLLLFIVPIKEVKCYMMDVQKMQNK